MTSGDDPSRPGWDDIQAARLHGARVLIGITRVGPDGAEQEQMFGTVRFLDVRAGIEVALEGSRTGATCQLPPDLRSFTRAAPGEYRLRTTGEVVVDPDYTALWTIEAPAR